MIVKSHKYMMCMTGCSRHPDSGKLAVRYSVFTWKLFGLIPLFRTYTPT